MSILIAWSQIKGSHFITSNINVVLWASLLSQVCSLSCYPDNHCHHINSDIYKKMHLYDSTYKQLQKQLQNLTCKNQTVLQSCCQVVYTTTTLTCYNSSPKMAVHTATAIISMNQLVTAVKSSRNSIETHGGPFLRLICFANQHACLGQFNQAWMHSYRF